MPITEPPKHVDVSIAKVPGPTSNWFVKPIKIARGGTITWHCSECQIYLWFPSKDALKGGTNGIHRKNPVTVTVGTNPGTYYYTMLVKDYDGHMHLVEGNSPPEVIIE